MCLGGGTSYPDLGPRDTSNEIIKSKYELSEENRARNLKRSGSLVTFDKSDNGKNEPVNNQVYDGDFGDYFSDLSEAASNMFGGKD